MINPNNISMTQKLKFNELLTKNFILSIHSYYWYKFIRDYKNKFCSIQSLNWVTFECTVYSERPIFVSCHWKCWLQDEIILFNEIELSNSCLAKLSNFICSAFAFDYIFTTNVSLVFREKLSQTYWKLVKKI